VVGGERAEFGGRATRARLARDQIDFPIMNEKKRAMGLYAAKNSVLVAARLGLGNGATRLLLAMALECWDDENNPAGQPARRYFAGREHSAIALGFLAPANGSEAAFRAVKRTVRELVDAGAIVRVRGGRNGQTSEYELNVDSARPFAGRASNVAVLRRMDNEGASNWSPQRASS
jgi:hypothetical protein